MRVNVKQVCTCTVPKEDKSAPAKKSDTKKSNKEVAKEVISGKWGNGDTRVKKLKAAGYDPAAVQKEVNKMMR